ncbi:hypothetical protein MKK69_10335 [Methylobacterium sp. J-026]|uniref:hypothetical protein n=1 Tax=Methylobacterium sp. J-026 TaxID=2836624 RepID=UPI001FB8804B|nr:hypothetical protein [Methylobacterium sp. J-026]MCJ2134444.1 hypothetical protein [Methylobacterium sp. J-026]
MVRFIVALVLCALRTVALAEEPSPAPPDAISRQAQVAQVAPGIGDHPKETAPATVRPAEVAEEGREFWPVIHGYRLKITDTLVAGFTALLTAVTWGLEWATQRLVRGAD